jgi:hypothetical protein
MVTVANQFAETLAAAGVRRSCCSPIAGWPTAVISTPASGSTDSTTRSGFIAATRS